MTTTWRVLPVEQDDAGALLARGLDLLEGLGADPTPTLRWYRATRTAVVLGRGQGDLRAVPRPGVEVHRRHSGGGAVLLDPHLLSLDVLVPTGHPLLDDTDLSAVFLHVGDAWARALTHLGVPDVTVHRGAGTARRRGSPREQLLAAVCYATLGRGEVSSGGRKLVGLSQRRRRPGALVQCGLLERWQPGELLRALGADPHDAEVHAAAVGLEEVVADPPPEPALRAAVEGALREA